MPEGPLGGPRPAAKINVKFNYTITPVNIETQAELEELAQDLVDRTNETLTAPTTELYKLINIKPFNPVVEEDIEETIVVGESGDLWEFSLWRSWEEQGTEDLSDLHLEIDHEARRNNRAKLHDILISIE